MPITNRAARRHAGTVRLIFAGALLALALVLAGCGSSSSDSLSAKTPQEILAASRTAARNATAVHVFSKLSGGGLTNTLELQLTSQGGHARITLLGTTAEVMRIGNTVYVKSSAPVYRRLARRAGVHMAPGTWLKIPEHGARLTGLAALTEPTRELARLLRDPTISLAKGNTTTINGEKAIELRAKSELYTGAIYIAATGEPYPLQIVKHGRETGQTTFTGWNHPVTLAAPARAIEVGKLETG